MISKLKEQIGNRILRRLLPDNFYFKQPGFCPCCERDMEFVAYHSWLRDSLRCTNCKSIPRNRALIRVLEQYYPNWTDLSIHESSPSGGGASARLRRSCSKYLASQYYPKQPFGTVIHGFRNENLESQTFPDQVFDIVVTQDVLEHVYDPASVFREIARTLKPGGLIFLEYLLSISTDPLKYGQDAALTASRILSTSQISTVILSTRADHQ